MTGLGLDVTAFFVFMHCSMNMTLIIAFYTYLSLHVVIDEDSIPQIVDASLTIAWKLDLACSGVRTMFV